jgi:hypothetical protein
MGTRSRIALHNPALGGAFTSIYVHWDGYPEGVGATLLEHYKDEDTVRRLLSHGDMSSLEDTPEASGAGAYKNRGETGVDARHSANLSQLSELTQDCGGEYLYVFKEGQWYVGEGGVSAFGLPATKAPGELRLLSEVLAEIEAGEGEE